MVLTHSVKQQYCLTVVKELLHLHNLLLCTEHRCQQTVSNEVICDTPTQERNVVQNICDNIVGQSILAAEKDSDSVHNAPEHQAVLNAMSDSDNVHNTSEKYSEKNTPETFEF